MNDAALIAEIAAAIEADPPLRPTTFEALALRLHDRALAKNPDYQRIVGHLPRPTRWQQIPSLPVTLFRDLPLTCFPPGEARITFLTSGTTGPRGRIRLLDTKLYDLGARRHAARVAGPIPSVGLSLVPATAESSLGHMCADLCPGLRHHFDAVMAGNLDLFLADLADYADTPLFLPGTAFAFAYLIEQLDQTLPGRQFPQPSASLLMITGGFKGRRASVDELHLRQLLQERFPGARLVEEYGMSELSSQLWAPGPGQPFVPPPWLGVHTIDPVTGAPQSPGLLCFCDLASVHTIPAIETRDIGEVLPDGRVRLLGRLPGEQPRGCSLSVEEAIQRQGPPSELWRPLAERDHLSPIMTGLPDPEPGLPRLHEPWSGDRQTLALARERARIHLMSGLARSGPPPAPPLSPEDADRVRAIQAALDRLGREDMGPLGQGLSREGATAAFGSARGALHTEGFARALGELRWRPRRLALSVAHGVFTSPLEWTVLGLSAGATVRLKAPTRDPAFVEALCAAMVAEGLPCTFTTRRGDLGEADLHLAFGSDQGVAGAAATTRAPTVRHGHRFSVGLTDGDPLLAWAWAWDVAWYDTRGCLAPVAFFCESDPEALIETLIPAMTAAEAAMPRGIVDPGLAPELRRRIGLARAHGRAVEGEGWAILQVPPEDFLPIALPRVLVLHPVRGPHEVRRCLDPWASALSTLVTDNFLRYMREPAWGPIYAGFPRLASPGAIQRPPFPRRHDGLEMLPPPDSL